MEERGMKALAFTAIMLLAIAGAACSGDDDTGGVLPEKDSDIGTTAEDGVSLSEDGTKAFHEAIGLVQAGDPVIRESATYAVARTLVKRYLLTPYSDLELDDRWIYEDSASFLVTVYMPHEDGEGEQEAVLDIKQDLQGYWYPDSVPDFDYSEDEKKKRQNLERIAEYEHALALFDQITLRLVLAEPDYDLDRSPPYLTRRFTSEVTNNTRDSHEVTVEALWSEVSENPRCDRSFNRSKTDTVEAGTTHTFIIERSSWSGGCLDITFTNVDVSIIEIDNYRKVFVEQELERLSGITSPTP